MRERKKDATVSRATSRARTQKRSPRHEANARREVRSTYRAGFAYLDGTLETSLRYLRRWAGARGLAEEDEPLLAHLARAAHLVRLTSQVCETVAGDVAMGLLRALLETTLSAYWMTARDEAARSTRFREYAELEDADLYCLLRSLGVEQPPGVKRYDRTRHEELRRRFRKGMLGWTQLSIDDLETQVRGIWPPEGAGDFARYVRLARQGGNRHIHLSAADALVRIERDGTRVTLRTGPTARTEVWVPVVLKAAGWWYGQLFDLVVERFAIGKLDEWRRMFESLTRKAERTP